MKWSVNFSRIMAHKKHVSFFTWQGRKQTVQGECLLNERQPNSPEHEDRAGWQRRKTRLQWLMWLSTQRIEKDIRASSYFFTRRVANLVSEACFTVTTGDRHDEPVWLNFSSFLFYSVFFLTLNSIDYTSVGCVWFSLSYVSLQSNWARKSLKLGMSILFFLWGFSYLPTF